MAPIETMHVAPCVRPRNAILARGEIGANSSTQEIELERGPPVEFAAA